MERPSEEPAKARLSRQESLILHLLSERMPCGVTNVELNQVCFRYGARLFGLRRKGYRIRTERRRNGLCRYYLEYPAPVGAVV